MKSIVLNEKQTKILRKEIEKYYDTYFAKYCNRGMILMIDDKMGEVNNIYGNNIRINYFYKH